MHDLLAAVACWRGYFDAGHSENDAIRELKEIAAARAFCIHCE